MEKKYFGFVYETTNSINNKKYIGKCIFDRLNGWRNYLGSGLYLKRAIEKYGKESFSREILFLAMDAEELNEIEEFMINASNAVLSNQYYNLKNTAIGGDVFTHHPRKEEIREMRRKQFAGEGNFWFGKEKPEYIIQSIKDANNKRVFVQGTLYESLTECASALDIKVSTLHYRLNSDFQTDYFYANDDGTKILKYINKVNSKEKKKVEIDGIVYESISKASELLGIGRMTISYRIKNGTYKMLNNDNAERLSKTR